MQYAQWVIVAVTAIFVAWVAFLQWRTAQQQAVLDLFDRRHSIYETIRKAVELIIRDSNGFDQTREAEFVQAMSRAHFFFGDDVVGYLERLWKAMIDVREADAELKNGSSHATPKRREAMSRVTALYKEVKPLFSKYIRFSQTTHLFGTPLGAWFIGAVRRSNRL